MALKEPMKSCSVIFSLPGKEFSDGGKRPLGYRVDYQIKFSQANPVSSLFVISAGTAIEWVRIIAGKSGSGSCVEFGHAYPDLNCVTCSAEPIEGSEDRCRIIFRWITIEIQRYGVR